MWLFSIMFYLGGGGGWGYGVKLLLLGGCLFANV